MPCTWRYLNEISVGRRTVEMSAANPDAVVSSAASRQRAILESEQNSLQRARSALVLQCLREDVSSSLSAC